MVGVYLRIAWRNIFRNRRRTLLTIVAISFGLLLVIVKGGQRNGQYAQMIDTSVRRSTGHIQVHRNGYWDHKTLRYAFVLDDVHPDAIEGVDGVAHVSPRLEVDALVGSGAENTTGARVIGVTPSRERAMTAFAGSVMTAGEFLADADTSGAVIGHTMARNLRADVGDELVVVTQARDGSMAAAVFDIKGIYRLGEPDIDGYTVIGHLDAVQQMLAADGRATSVALTVDDHRNVDAVVAAIEKQLGDPDAWEVMSYETLMPTLVQTIAFDWAVDVVFQTVLLVVIAFGILNTILMSVMERFHEFGVLMAVGMRPRAVGVVVFLEGILLSGVALVVGNVFGYLINDWWRDNAIVIGGSLEAIEGFGFDLLMFAVPDLGQQAVWSVVMLGMTLCVAMWPAWVAMRFRPVEAISLA